MTLLFEALSCWTCHHGLGTLSDTILLDVSVLSGTIVLDVPVLSSTIFLDVSMLCRMHCFRICYVGVLYHVICIMMPYFFIDPIPSHYQDGL